MNPRRLHSDAKISISNFLLIMGRRMRQNAPCVRVGPARVRRAPTSGVFCYCNNQKGASGFSTVWKVYFQFFHAMEK